MTLQVTSGLGMVALMLLAWLLSSHRRIVPWRVVVGGTALQILLAMLVLRTDGGAWLFARANDTVGQLMSFAMAGAGFLFAIHRPGQAADRDLLTSFAFSVLPSIIFFSSLMGVLYHLGVMQVVVRGMAAVMQATLRTSGPETLSVAANVFVGQTEAPLVVRPYLASMTRSELNALMTGGFATVTGSLVAAYVQMGVSAGDVITASVISAPAALVAAKLMEPETEPEKTVSSLALATTEDSTNIIGAAVDGAAAGLRLAANVGAMLIAFIALVALIDWLLGQTGAVFGQVDAEGRPLWQLASILGWAFSPLAWLMGIAPDDCREAGRLLGIKMVANEFIAYQELGELLKAPSGPAVSERTTRIMTYALCGFSNFGAIGVQVGGIGGMVPERRSEIARLGLRAMIAGSIACMLTGCVAGMLID